MMIGKKWSKCYVLLMEVIIAFLSVKIMIYCISYE